MDILCWTIRLCMMCLTVEPQCLLQAMGENVLGAILEFGKSMAEGKDKTCKERKLIFFDFLGLIMASPFPCPCIQSKLLLAHSILYW